MRDYRCCEGASGLFKAVFGGLGVFEDGLERINHISCCLFVRLSRDVDLGVARRHARTTYPRILANFQRDRRPILVPETQIASATPRSRIPPSHTLPMPPTRKQDRDPDYGAVVSFSISFRFAQRCPHLQDWDRDLPQPELQAGYQRMQITDRSLRVSIQGCR